MLKPLHDLVRGFGTYWRGLQWLGKNPHFLAILFLPLALGFVCLFVFGGILLSHREALVAHLLYARPSGTLALAFYYVCRAFLYLGILIASLLCAFLVMNVLSAPLYEVVSRAIEKKEAGTSRPKFGLWKSLALMFEELKKALFIGSLSLALLVIPGLGFLGLWASGFLLAWDLYDYPLARRGWSLGRRLRFVAADFWAVTGLGLWLMIPFSQLVTLPLAVAGATLLSLEHLQTPEHSRS